MKTKIFLKFLILFALPIKINSQEAKNKLLIGIRKVLYAYTTINFSPFICILGKNISNAIVDTLKFTQKHKYQASDIKKDIDSKEPQDLFKLFDMTQSFTEDRIKRYTTNGLVGLFLIGGLTLIINNN